MEVIVLKSTENERLFSCLIYVLSFFTVLIGPLIIWLLKKDSPFVNYHGKQYFNFLLSYFLYICICFPLVFILIGFVLIWILGIFAFVFTIVAAIKAYDGEEYSIPLSIRFFK